LSDQPQHGVKQADQQRIDQQIDQVPQMVPGGREDGKLEVEIEIIGVKRPEAGADLALAQELEIGLWGDEDIKAEQQRQADASQARPSDPTGRGGGSRPDAGPHPTPRRAKAAARG
jgi:hypothetical protein